MAIYRLWSGATGAGTGADWENAFTTLAAVLAVATASGDVITPDVTHLESLTASQTYTAQNNIAIVVVDKNNVLSIPKMDAVTGGILTTSTVAFDGAYKVYMRGFAVKSSGLGGSMLISLARSDGAHFELEKSLLWLSAASNTGYFAFGYDSGTRNAFVKLKDCEVRNANSAFRMAFYSRFVMEGGTLNLVSGTPVVHALSNGGLPPEFYGVDMSASAMTLLPDATSRPMTAYFDNCKLHASTVTMTTQTITNNSAGEAWLRDCAAGDVHINMAHINPLGSTVVSTSVYANDGMTHDGTNRCSWVVSSSANASFFAPYVSPWWALYNDTLSPITPSIEVCRDGSATPYTDAEIWPEFAYKGYSGNPMVKFASGRMEPLGTPANHATSSKGAGDWTGESGTAWFGTLDSGEITPAEIGYMQARICIGAANASVYLDPQIRAA